MAKLDPQERIIELLEELVVWTRLSGREGLRALLLSTLVDPKHKRAYEATDGKKTQSDVAEFSGLSQPRVSALYQRWARLGIIYERESRYSHVVSLVDVGIDVPPLNMAAKGDEQA
jgi:hypothetical protein